MTKVFILEKTFTLHKEQFKDIIDKKLPQQASITPNTFTETGFEAENHTESSYALRKESTPIISNEDISIDNDSFSKSLIKFGIEIKESNPIGKGNFGAVYKGFKKEKPVAIKILHSNSDQATKELLKEVAILR